MLSKCAFYVSNLSDYLTLKSSSSFREYFRYLVIVMSRCLKSVLKTQIGVLHLLATLDRYECLFV